MFTMTFTICLLIFLIICHSPSNDSNYFIKNAFVDTIFYPPSICMLDPEKFKNIIFSPWGRKNIQNSVVRPVRASEHLKCLFQLKWPKCPWLALGLTEGGPKNPNFDPVIRKGWNQCHCEDYKTLITMTIHGSKSKLEWPRYHENRDDAPIDTPQTSESHNFWSNRWIFKIHTFSNTRSQELFRGVRIHSRAIATSKKFTQGYK